MAANPVNVGNVKGWANARKISGTVGAAALTAGQLCKITAGLFVTAADNDKPTATRLYICGGNYAASAVDAVFVPAEDVLFTLSYSGGTPTVGVAYGISSGTNIDVTDTTNDCVEAVEVDTDKLVAWCVLYTLSA